MSAELGIEIQSGHFFKDKVSVIGYFKNKSAFWAAYLSALDLTDTTLMDREDVVYLNQEKREIHVFSENDEETKLARLNPGTVILIPGPIF